jgi:alpha-mannosidase
MEFAGLQLNPFFLSLQTKIDQTTLGHEFLKRELGVIPKVGWQLDPFGHSATQASLLAAAVGFDALYFGRIDYQDLEIRQGTQECEGLWASSASAGLNQTIFWGLTGGYVGNYQAPDGFCYDVHCRDDLPTSMNKTALLKSVNKFLEEMKVQSYRTKGNHIMVRGICGALIGTAFLYTFMHVTIRVLSFILQS